MDTLLNLVDEVKTNMTDQQYRNIVDQIAALRVEEEKKDTDIFKVLCVIPVLRTHYDRNETGQPSYLIHLEKRVFLFTRKFVESAQLKPGCDRQYDRFHRACLTYQGNDDVLDANVEQFEVGYETVVIISIEKV